MSSQEADDPPIIFGRGTRTAVFFVLDNHAVLRRETKTNLIKFIVGVKTYMEVSSETSDVCGYLRQCSTFNFIHT